MIIKERDIQTIHPEEYVNNSFQYTIIDIREPVKFKKGHIPDSINIPYPLDLNALIPDYKIYSENNEWWVNLIKKQITVGSKNIIIYCDTGKIHSKVFSNLLKQHKIGNKILQGGYQAYRKYISVLFSQPCKLILVGGETGSGKTKILKYLGKLGEQYLDLEEIANHKGSVFGGIATIEQPSHEQFQNNVFKKLTSMDISRRIWIEDEVKHIGSVGIPDGLWESMQNAVIVKLNVPKDIRVHNIIAEYGKLNIEKLKDAIGKIRPRLGELNATKAIDYLMKGNLTNTVDILLNYYDRAYRERLAKRKNERIIPVHFTNLNIESMAYFILGTINKV